MTRALDFFHNGGIVIAIGSLPEASDHAGGSDPELDEVVKELFGASASEMKSGKRPSIRKDISGGIGIFIENDSDLVNLIGSLLPKHVKSESHVKYMHRKVGFRDIFMVMGATKGFLAVTFRAKGNAELWIHGPGITCR